jgi:solute:Na+ symporter, SSS family
MNIYHWTFFIPVAVYFLLILWVSVLSYNHFKDKEKLGDDSEFFLAGRGISVVLSFMSVMATETSVATIVVFPAVGFASGYSLIWLIFGYIAGRTAVAFWYLPRIYAGQGISIYSNLTGSSGAAGQLLNSAYLLAKYISSGVRFFLGGFALSSVFGGEIIMWLFIIASVAGLYSVTGGLRSVIWTDLIQGLIIILASLFFIIPFLAGQGTEIVTLLSNLSYRNTDFNYSNDLYFLALFSGGAVLSIGTHGADQDMILRVLAAKSPAKARISLIISGFVAGFVIFLYLTLGVMLKIIRPDIDARSPFLAYIKEINDPLILGVFAVLLMAAAMSTLDSAMHSTAAVLKDRFRTGNNRLWSFVSLSIIFISGIIFINIEKYHKDLLSLAMSSMNYLNGGLIAVFTAVIIFRLRPGIISVAACLVSGFLVTVYSNWFLSPVLSWTWTIVVSSGIALLVFFAVNLAESMQKGSQPEGSFID